MENRTPPPNIDKELVHVGNAIVIQFFVLLKTAKSYEIGHSALNIPLSNLIDTVLDIHNKGEEPSLRMNEGYITMGEIRLKPDASSFKAFEFVMEKLNSLSVAALEFYPSMKSAELDKFCHLLMDIKFAATDEPFESLKQDLYLNGIDNIEIEELPAATPDMEIAALVNNKEESKKLYLQTVHVASEVMKDVKMGKTLKLRKSKRVVQGLIDQFLTAETNLLGLTTIRCHDEYTFNHSVNVCILSVSIGQRLGLSKELLCDLGMAALFHDIGKSDVPIEILNKPSEFNEKEWEVIRRHPVLGVKNLMLLKGFEQINTRIILGAFEHHLNYDLSGYPDIPDKDNISLFGRIIAIADAYDGLTSSRVYSRTPKTPDKALKFMMERSGTVYDPVLLKLFINCVGVYPIGAMFLLNTRELAVVVESARDMENWSRPVVKIVSDRAGNEIDGETIDLSDDVSGRSIAKTIDPLKFDINVSKYFV